MIDNIKNLTQMSLFAVVYKGSTNLEGPGSYGVSHLLEHLMCRNFDDLYDDFESSCINWNAFTSSNEIVFYISGLEEDVAKFRQPWYQRLTENFIITPAQFEQEKKIVLQEYSDCFVESNGGNALNLLRQWYGSYQPIGTKEDLIALTYDQMLDLHSKIYSAPSQIINISPTWTCDWNIKFQSPELKKYSLNFNNNTVLEKIPETDKNNIYIFTETDQNVGELNLITEIICGGLQSPMYQELREKLGLCYFISFSPNPIGDTTIYMINSSTTEDCVESFINKTLEIFEKPDEFISESHYNAMIEKVKRKLKQQEWSITQKFHYLLDDKENRYDTVLETITYPRMMELIKNHFSHEKWTTVVDNKYIKGKC